MPMYSYRCANCYTIWDVFHKFDEATMSHARTAKGHFLNTMALSKFHQRLSPHEAALTILARLI